MKLPLVLAALIAGVHSVATANDLCDADNGGIVLDQGFCAMVVADGLGKARHLVVRDNGDIYVALRGDNGGVLALRDSNGDGRADVREQFFDEEGGTGIGISEGYLYFGADQRIRRWKLDDNELIPVGDPQLVATLPQQRVHAAKSLAFDGAGELYVNVGAPSNACQKPSRTAGVAGQDPCALLERHGGIWRFSTDKTSQQQSDGVRYATGIRNAVAVTWNTANDTLYIVQHGRDQLDTLWPDVFTEEQRIELPAEEMFEVQLGDDFGWPYCYYDPFKKQKVLNPEYGGDGDKVGRCSEFADPIAAFPAHWAPNGIVFYDGTQFPEPYRGGAFIVFHGSWNRSPEPQAGFNIVFVPFADGRAAGDWHVFADKFAGKKPPKRRRNARHRPSGVATGPDGSLYVSEDETGRIWRISYVGE